MPPPLRYFYYAITFTTPPFFCDTFEMLPYAAITFRHDISPLLLFMLFADRAASRY